MSNTRQLNDNERVVARRIVDHVRNQIQETSKGDEGLKWAMRRYVYIRLQYDERGNPMQRKMLKLEKMVEQKGKCPLCKKELPKKGAELDRLETMNGYTRENTRLLCHGCHQAEQAKRRFS